VKPIPPFAPKVLELELATVTSLVTIPDEQLYPHQSQTGWQTVLVPDGISFVRLVVR